jgi:hypothetical protein
MTHDRPGVTVKEIAIACVDHRETPARAVPSGRLDRRRCCACFTRRSGSAVDLLPVGIVQRASAFTECCRADAALMPEVPPVIGAIP